MISFARGAPAPECLDAELIGDCARAAVQADRAVLGYGAGGGYGPLREWLGDRHGVEPSRIVVTSGGLQGIAFWFEELLAQRPGRVLVEAPTYDRPLKQLARLGAEVVPLQMDAEGLDPDALERELAGGGASFLYTIPTFQNPSGRTLSTERRRALVELAAAHGLPVLEDDPYGLVRYEGEPPPSLHELEGGELVTYASSFSKTIAPGIRVGWFVLPAPLAARIEERAVSTYISPPFLTQATVLELHRRGAFEPNLERIRGLLRARRDALVEALARELGGRVTWTTPAGGYFLWVDASGRGSRAARPRRGGAASRFVKGADFFPGAGGEQLGATRLQLRVAVGDRRGRRRARLARLSASGLTHVRERPSPCMELRDEDAGEQPGEEREQDHPDQRGLRFAEDEVDARLVVVADDEGDHIGDDQDQPGKSEPETRLPGAVEAAAAGCPCAESLGRRGERGPARRRGTSRGWGGGVSTPAVARRKVGQGLSLGRAQRPARRK